MKTPITIAWLAYKTDSKLFWESFKCAKRTLLSDDRFAPTFIMLDDAWNPVDLDIRQKFLSDEDVCTQRLVTSYPRTGMLIGGENLEGQIRAFCLAEEATPYAANKIFVKMDCDAMLFKTEWLHKFAMDDRAVVAGAFDFGSRNHTSVYGYCYALKASMLRPLMADIETYPAHHHAWEDHEVSSRIFRIRQADMDYAHRYVPGAESGFVCCPLNAVNETFIRGNVVTFAWDYQISQDKTTFRRQVGEWMCKLNELADKQSAGLKEQTPKGETSTKT